MCTALLIPGVNQIAVKNISYHIIEFRGEGGYRLFALLNRTSSDKTILLVVDEHLLPQEENSSLPSCLEDKPPLPHLYCPLQRCPADRIWHHLGSRQGLPVVCGIAWVWWWDGEDDSLDPRNVCISWTVGGQCTVAYFGTSRPYHTEYFCRRRDVWL